MASIVQSSLKITALEADEMRPFCCEYLEKEKSNAVVLKLCNFPQLFEYFQESVYRFQLSEVFSFLFPVLFHCCTWELLISPIS